MDGVFGSTIVGLCGGSGSGKTTLARELASAIGRHRCRVISFDSYYHDLTEMTTEERAGFNFDAPDSLDVDLLTSHLTSLRNGVEATVPVYDFSTNTRSGNFEVVSPSNFVIIEGILLFAFADIRDLLDYRIFIDCPTDIRYQRRLARDMHERGRTESSVYYQWRNTVAPMHDLHVQPYAPHAHYLSTYGSPAADIAKAILRELNAIEIA